jgi:hypothetical protein
MSSDDQQHQPGNQVEKNEDDLEKSESGINDHVKGVARHGDPLGMHAVNKIRNQQKHQGGKDQHATIDDGTPHEKCGQCLDIHKTS